MGEGERLYLERYACVLHVHVSCMSLPIHPLKRGIHEPCLGRGVLWGSSSFLWCNWDHPTLWLPVLGLWSHPCQLTEVILLPMPLVAQLHHSMMQGHEVCGSPCSAWISLMDLVLHCFIPKWLSFYLQDTVVSLQALSQYAALFPQEMRNVNVTVKGKEASPLEFHVHRNNKLVLQQASLLSVPGMYTVQATGSGCVYVQVSIQNEQSC